MSTETFDPIAAGWKIQRGYRILPQVLVVEDEMALGNKVSTALAERDCRRITGLRLRTDSRDACEYFLSFYRRNRGAAARFYMEWPELVPSPDAAPVLEAIAGGTQAQRTITARFAWKNTVGTTKASPTGSLLIPANNLIKVTVPVYPANVTQAVIYAAEDDPGNEEEQATLTNTFSWTQPDAALLTGTADPPTANTARETPLCKFVNDENLGPERGIGTTYELVLEIEEIYAA